MDTIYAPMTINILTVGHIKFIKKLCTKGNVIVGLLTRKALKGYKKELMPFRNRLYILHELGLWIKIVPQNTLSPHRNLIKYKCTALASGDGFEKSELESAKKLGLKLINIKSGEKLHSSHIK